MHGSTPCRLAACLGLGLGLGLGSGLGLGLGLELGLGLGLGSGSGSGSGLGLVPPARRTSVSASTPPACTISARLPASARACSRPAACSAACGGGAAGRGGGHALGLPALLPAREVMARLRGVRARPQARGSALCCEGRQARAEVWRDAREYARLTRSSEVTARALSRCSKFLENFSKSATGHVNMRVEICGGRNRKMGEAQGGAAVLRAGSGG